MTNPKPLVPSVAYLRMSTESQQYSLANQMAAIKEYAAANQFQVIGLYRDAARSGLVLRNRSGLKALLHDAVCAPPFKAILVYDVSRWGRFQDADEAAHYEYICRSAGIQVCYCAEQFTNDGTLTSLVLKNLKRAMAAEYSRELGEKVLRGQRRLVEMGYKMGGSAVFGTRRLLIGADGTPKQILAKGERKSLATDRVVYVRGPQQEVDTARLIFQLILEKGYRPQRLVRTLNELGLLYFEGKPWNRGTMDNLVRNSVYTGRNVWGKTTCRLQTSSRPTPESRWSFKVDCFDPIIKWQTFKKVQEYLGSWRWSDEELLEGLREVWGREGKITQELLCRVGYGPCYTTVVSRFGTFADALLRIGYRQTRNDKEARRRSAALQAMHLNTVRKIAHLFPDRLEVALKKRSPRRSLLLDRRYRIQVLFAPQRFTSHDKTCWSLQPRQDERHFITLCCLLDRHYSNTEQMFLIRGFAGTKAKWAFRDDRQWSERAVRLPSIADFCDAVFQVAEKPLIPSFW